ncbi:MAG: prolyl oligopeptidase family serine peptidase, partial [Chloroflexota bacterium]|nr:prolyl oligopeptidase family serine peptidase [Chloroflexota bacterium]
PAGRDDPRVVNLSQALARAGFAVLVPWSDVMTQRRLDVDSPDSLVWAFQYLSGLDYVDSQRVGLAGFCVGASIAVVAAEDSRINEQVSFVNDFGGYYDARDFLVQIASRTSFQNGAQAPWVVGDLTREVFTAELLSAVDDSEEHAFLSHVFTGGGSVAPQEVEALSPAASAVYRLLSGVSLEEARRLLTLLPPRAQEVFDRVSPSTHVSNLVAPVLIMHDREDDAVPVEESRRFYEALGQRGDVTYTEFSFFQHVDPTRRVSIGTFLRESYKLYRHLFRIVSQAT